MEKRQEQPLDTPKLSTPGQPDSPPQAQRSTIQSLMGVLEVRPLIFWSGIWVSMLLVAMVSVSSLLSPGLVDERTASEAAFGGNSAEAAQQVKQRSRVPLWLFGAIALTCTAGSFLISKQLARPQSPRSIVRKPASRKQSKSRPPRKGRKRLKPYSPADSPLPLPVYPSAQVQPPAPVPAPLQLSGKSAGRLRRVSPPLTSKLSVRPTKVSVTVVPDEENHPLDWQAASLVDSVDLRKRRSLSSWL